MFGGVPFVTWYPITPSSSLAEPLIDYLKGYRLRPKTGKATYAIVQAEDDRRARHGARSGLGGRALHDRHVRPGHLADGGVHGYAYYAEIPAVIWDVQRIGPSTGLPTRTSQGDLLSPSFSRTATRSTSMLFPCSVEECFTMAIEAFDLAEGLQTPVFVLSDLDLGMNIWMSDPFAYPEKPMRTRQGPDGGRPRRGSASSSATATWTVTASPIARCRAPRTRWPRTSRAAAATTRRLSTASGPRTTSNNMDRLARKVRNRARARARARHAGRRRAEVGIIAYGTSHWAVAEACDQLAQEHGLKADYCRLRAFPLRPAGGGVRPPPPARLRS